MNTQEITLMIKANVPVGRHCYECNSHQIIRGDCHCILFDKPLRYSNSYNKCHQCIDACGNGTEPSLKELEGRGSNGL